MISQTLEANATNFSPACCLVHKKYATFLALRTTDTVVYINVVVLLTADLIATLENSFNLTSLQGL